MSRASAVPSRAGSFRPTALSLFSDRACAIVVGTLLVFGVVFLIAPLIAVVGTSLNAPPAIIFPPASVTLDAYRQIPANWYDAFFASVKLATIAAVLGAFISLPAAFALVRGTFPGRPLVETFFRSPLQVPQVVLSVSLYQFYVLAQNFVGKNIFGGFQGLVVAHTLMISPYILGTLVGRIGGIDRSIEEAAEGLGARPLRTFFQVTLPLIRPALLAALILAFVISFDNVTLSLFLTADASSTTFPVTLFSAIELSASPVVFAAAALTIVVSVVVTTLLQRLIGLRGVVAR